MSFPIQFAQSTGSADYLSPVLNFAGNTATVIAATITAGFVTNLALKHLGFTDIATKMIDVIPVSIASLGVVPPFATAITVIAITYAASKLTGR